MRGKMREKKEQNKQQLVYSIDDFLQWLHRRYDLDSTNHKPQKAVVSTIER